MKRIGYAGIVNYKSDFESVTDGYCQGGATVQAVNVYKSKTEAKKRYEEIREVFIREK